MRTITVISAHGQGIAAFKRHAKFWQHYDQKIIVSPENDELPWQEWPAWHRFTCGNAEHNGRESWKRFQSIMSALKSTVWDWCVMHEYDSFCLDPKLPEHPGFYGVLWENKESPKFMASRYANPPWTFDRESFVRMASIAETYPGIYENGEADRYWSALAQMASVPILAYDPPGFSRGTIDERSIKALRKAIHGGAYAIHGVKSEWALRAVEEFWEGRLKTP